MNKIDVNYMNKTDVNYMNIALFIVTIYSKTCP